MADCSLEEEDEGQALSFSQRSLLKVNVTRGRFSQSQCLGTLCLKREEEEEPRGKKDRSFLVFLLFFFFFKGLYNTTRPFQRNGQERKSCKEILGSAPCNPKKLDFEPRDLCEAHIFLRSIFIYVSIPSFN